ncbi:MAG: GTPase [Myxococcales bacterium]|nr:GTPase [Myxococcales bacterium]MDD9967114.1 GTPase [Myxococcales bacterium]
MSLLNPLSGEISAKIVYYGPGLSGKTTSLQHIHRAVRPERRGDLVSLATETDRTLFFDFLPLHVERVRGLSVRLQLYTVPGQVFYAATRKLVLGGADGVVFVADSQPHCHDANLESLEAMRVSLAEFGIDLSDFPLVFQYNKRDLDSAVPIGEMSAAMNFLGAPEHGTVARNGDGVLEALRDISKLVIKALAQQQPSVRKQIVEERPGDVDEGIAGQIRSAARAARDSQLAAKRLDSDPAEAETGGPSPGTAQAPEGSPLSFAELVPVGQAEVVGEIERCIREGRNPHAVQLAASGLSDLLSALPGPHDATASVYKGALLGLDGREYLRLCRLEAAPPEAVSRRDALFALHVLISAHLKAGTL